MLQDLTPALEAPDSILLGLFETLHKISMLFQALHLESTLRSVKALKTTNHYAVDAPCSIRFAPLSKANSLPQRNHKTLIRILLKGARL